MSFVNNEFTPSLYHGYVVGNTRLTGKEIQAEVHGYKEINVTKNNMLPLKTTHWIADFYGNTSQIDS